MYVCMHVRLCVCMYACMYVCICICLSLTLSLFLLVSLCLSLSLCFSLYVSLCLSLSLSLFLSLTLYLCPPFYPLLLLCSLSVCVLRPVADQGGGKSGHGPPSKLAMKFAPLGGRKSNDSIVNLPH